MHAGEMCIHPTTTGRVSIFYDHDRTYYYKDYGYMWYGEDYYIHTLSVYDAFLKFSLDSLPDTCIILSAELAYFQYEHNELPDVDIKLIGDPEPQSADGLYSEIESAPAITPVVTLQDGWMTWAFDTAALSLLDSCRETGWSSFGIHMTSNNEWAEAQAYGYDGTEPPYLLIEYASSGTRENRGTPAKQPELIITPNPTTGRFVMVHCDTEGGTCGKLALHDALGRTARSFSLDPFGRTGLNLRGLAPGVYMATLKGTIPPVSRKLVITAH